MGDPFELPPGDMYIPLVHDLNVGQSGTAKSSASSSDKDESRLLNLYSLLGAFFVAAIWTGVSVYDNHPWFGGGVALCGLAGLSLTVILLLRYRPKTVHALIFTTAALVAICTVFAYVLWFKPKQVIVHDPPTAEDIAKAATPTQKDLDAKGQELTTLVAPNQTSIASLVRNGSSGTIGSLNFTGNTAIGVSTVLDNAGAVGQASVDRNLLSGPSTAASAQLIENSGRIGVASVTNNTIRASEGSNSGSNQPQSTADSPSPVPSLGRAGRGAFIRTTGENSELWFVENTTSGDNVFLDNSGRLDRTAMSDNHISSTNRPGGPLIINNSGHGDRIYITNNNVERTYPDNKSESSWGNEAIPSGVLSEHAIRLRDGTFASSISLSLAAPIKPDYVTVALKGINLLGFFVGSNPRINELRLVPIAGYAITKLIRPSGPIKIVVHQSQPDCYAKG